MAKFNSVSRLWFSSAKDGLWFKKIKADPVHPKYRTPYIALTWYYIAVMVLALIAGFSVRPIQWIGLPTNY
ncbi:MAG: hypothetical protein ACP5NQ_02755 [Vulcanisaeta sp.]